MYWAMVGLTFTMSAALALQLGGWLWEVNPRLLVVGVAIASFPLGIFLMWRESMLHLWKEYRGNPSKKQTRSRFAQLFRPQSR